MEFWYIHLSLLSDFSLDKMYYFRWASVTADSKESACSAGELGLVLVSGRSPEGNGYPLQWSCPENSMDRRAWQVGLEAQSSRPRLKSRPRTLGSE